MMEREDIERKIIGTIISSDSIDYDSLSLLNENMFSNTTYRELFIATNEIRVAGSPVNLLSVTQALRLKKRLEYVGGVAFVSHLCDMQNMIFLMDHQTYCLKLAEFYFRSCILATANEIMRYGLDDSLDIFEALGAAEQSAFKLSQVTNIVKDKPKHQIISELLLEIESADSSTPPGLPFCIHEIDERTGGLIRGGLTVIAGRPGMGKTALAVSIANAMSLKNDIPGAFFSLEMKCEMIYRRFLAINGDQSFKRMLWGGLSGPEWEATYESANRIVLAKLQVFDKYFRLNEIVSKIRTMHSAGELNYAIIDYLQLVSGDSKQIREQEVAHISRTLKVLAMQLDIPIIALSQLSRAVETRGGDKKPLMSDLRESGSLEQDAELVLFCYRPTYYGIMQDEYGESLENYAFIIQGKNRNGDLRDIKLAYRGSHNQEWATMQKTSPQSFPDNSKLQRGLSDNPPF